jgi:hypothetical protein
MLTPAPKLQAMFVFLTKGGSKELRILKLDTRQRCVQSANLVAESPGGNSSSRVGAGGCPTTFCKVVAGVNPF